MKSAKAMRVRIHCGSHEIGGSCVELEAQDHRLVLDIGRPLNAALDEEVPLPAVEGLASGGDPNLLGVVISHGHPDHYGLMDQVSQDVPVYIGEAAARILSEAAFFSRTGLDLKPSGFLIDQ